MRLLTSEEFRETFSDPMQRVVDEPPPFDFWSYFEAIPVEDFAGHDCSAGEVDNVWRHPDGHLEHVLVNAREANVFMVLVLDRVAGRVVGHHLLDLNREYALDEVDERHLTSR
jgi:hypothetical protein